MVKKKRYRVGCRMLVEGFIDVEASSARTARPMVLDLLSGGMDTLPQIQEPKVVAHDAVEKQEIIELLGGEPIGKKRKVGDES